MTRHRENVMRGRVLSHVSMGLWLSAFLFMGAAQAKHVADGPQKQAATAAVADMPEDYADQAILRHWREPFRRIPYNGAYVSLLSRSQPQGPPLIELWQNTWGSGGAPERAIVVRRGSDLDALGPEQEVLNGLLIDDVFEPGTSDVLAPMRGFTRPSMQWYEDIGYVLLACVCPDYRPGSVNLLPAILTSATGQPGSWTYHGILRGDVAEAAAARLIWSDGGTLVRMPDNSWRIYLNGFGTVMAMLESETLDGPWRFLRNADGAIRELLPAFPKGPRRGGCFPAILRVSDTEWHVWMVDTWPPRGIFHYWSADGIAWSPYGAQPEITAAAIEGNGIKCLRPAFAADGARILGLLSVWQADDQGRFAWRLHVSSMPSGPPPD